jgi:transcriptional regulator with XRE-family HTH domain
MGLEAHVSARPKRKSKVSHEPVVARFGERMRQLRLARGLTVERLARLAGLDSGYLGRVERAESAVGIDTAARIAAALKASLAELLPDDTIDPLPMMRHEAEDHFAAIIQTADAATFSMLNPVLLMLRRNSARRAGQDERKR